jgi:hypothetical protein
VARNSESRKLVCSCGSTDCGLGCAVCDALELTEHETTYASGEIAQFLKGKPVLYVTLFV